MSEFEPKQLNSGDMGNEPPKTGIGTDMTGDNAEKALEIIRSMSPGELRELNVKLKEFFFSPLE